MADFVLEKSLDVLIVATIFGLKAGSALGWF
jgi:hypothetical protein